jgi:hypothetical protein
VKSQGHSEKIKIRDNELRENEWSLDFTQRFIIPFYSKCFMNHI